MYIFLFFNKIHSPTSQQIKLATIARPASTVRHVSEVMARTVKEDLNSARHDTTDTSLEGAVLVEFNALVRGQRNSKLLMNIARVGCVQACKACTSL